MLLNLDLFASAGSQGPDATNTSMLEQIQTLRAMGYLNGTDAPGPQPAYINPPPPPPQLPADTEDDIRE